MLSRHSRVMIERWWSRRWISCCADIEQAPAHGALLNFTGRMRTPPKQVRLVHGDEDAKATLAGLLRQRHPGLQVVVP